MRGPLLLIALTFAGCAPPGCEPLSYTDDAGPCAANGFSQSVRDCRCPIAEQITSELDGHSCPHAGLACSNGLLLFVTECTCEGGSWRCDPERPDLSVHDLAGDAL